MESGLIKLAGKATNKIEKECEQLPMLTIVPLSFASYLRIFRSIMVDQSIGVIGERGMLITDCLEVLDKESVID